MVPSESGVRAKSSRALSHRREWSSALPHRRQQQPGLQALSADAVACQGLLQGACCMRAAVRPSCTCPPTLSKSKKP